MKTVALFVFLLSLFIYHFSNEAKCLLYTSVYHLFSLYHQYIPTVHCEGTSPKYQAFVSLMSLTKEPDDDLVEARKHFESIGEVFGAPKGVFLEGAAIERGDGTYLKGVWFIPYKIEDDEKVLLHFHGGGMVAGSAESEALVSSYIVKQFGVKMLSVNYRLLPEHSMRESIADGVMAYKYLLNYLHIKPENIMVIGCSAGGSMSIYTLLALLQSHIPLPAGGILGSVSPGLELLTKKNLRDYSSHSLPKCTVGFLENTTLEWFTGMLLRDEDNEKYLMELFKGVEQLPPLIWIGGELEVLRDLQVEFVDIVKKRGVDIQHYIIISITSLNIELLKILSSKFIQR